MNIDDFLNLSENLKKNIAEVKTTTKTCDLLEPLNSNSFARTVYLFQSIAKSMVDIGNGIIIESDFRTPLNTADVFISLAEHGVISPSIVPGLKKAAMAIPRIQSSEDTELLEVITNSIEDLKRCLNAFTKHFKSKESEV
jgi:uncharacterized protein YutE (UPF0331/DUF86 family)